jgi:hypothetical protein
MYQGYTYLRNENDIMAYSPYGARSRDEFAIYQDFFARDGAAVYALVLIVPKDNKTMLRMKQLNASVEVVQNRVETYTAAIKTYNGRFKIRTT